MRGPARIAWAGLRPLSLPIRWRLALLDASAGAAPAEPAADAADPAPPTADEDAARGALGCMDGLRLRCAALCAAFCAAQCATAVGGLLRLARAQQQQQEGRQHPIQAG